MEKPWRVDGTDEVVEVRPERWLFDAGDWTSVSEHLGLQLPAEYTDLVGRGRALEFDEELMIGSPFDENVYCNLIGMHASAAYSLAFLRHEFPEDYDVAIYPEEGGLLCWGGDGSGGQYFYDTSDWSVALSGRPVDGVIRYPMTLVQYLAALGDGSVISETVGEWPSPRPRIRPRTVSQADQPSKGAERLSYRGGTDVPLGDQDAPHPES